MLEKEQWTRNSMEIPCLESDTRSYFDTFIRSVRLFLNRTGEDIGQFSAGPINKAVPSFTNSLTKVREW